MIKNVIQLDIEKFNKYNNHQSKNSLYNKKTKIQEMKKKNN